MEWKAIWLRGTLVIILAAGACYCESTTYDFFSLCGNMDVFVSLTDKVSVIIDGETSDKELCSVKFTAAQRDTKLQFVFEEKSLISKDVSISTAHGVDGVLWTQKLMSYLSPPVIGKAYAADEQLKITVSRLNGAGFYFRLVITANVPLVEDFKLTEWAIVGIVFGSLVVINIFVIMIGLAYKKKRKLKRMKTIGTSEEHILPCKQDNLIVRNTLSSRIYEEYDVPVEDNRDTLKAYTKHGPTPPISLVAQYLTSQRPAIREIPILPRGRNTRNAFGNNRTIFNINAREAFAP